MKNPKVDIIEAGDVVQINDKPYIACQSTLKNGVCFSCAFYSYNKRSNICTKINCRNIIYKYLLGGV